MERPVRKSVCGPIDVRPEQDCGAASQCARTMPKRLPRHARNPHRCSGPKSPIFRPTKGSVRDLGKDDA